MAHVDRWQQNGLHFAAKATQHESFPVLVWCGFVEMKAENPVFEDPAAEVWFKYAATREEAIAHLLKEVFPGSYTEKEIMSKIEINIPNGSSSDKENRLYVDGELILGITDFVLHLDVNKTPELTITKYVFDEEGRHVLKDGTDGEKELTTEVIRFSGKVVLDGFEQTE